MREFEFIEGTSKKFWKIELKDTQHTVHFGRIGTNGQTKTKDFDSEAAAQKAYDKLIAEKLKEGYKEITGGSSAASAPAAVNEEPPAAPKAKAKKAAEPEPAPTAAPVPTAKTLTITHELGLEPEDRRWVTYQPRQQLERPAPKPFDLDACVKRLSKIDNRYQFWHWHTFNLPTVMTPDEAYFWLKATQFGTREATHETVEKKLRGLAYPGTYKLSEVVSGFTFDYNVPMTQITRCLVNMTTPAEFARYLLDDTLTQTLFKQQHYNPAPLQIFQEFSANVFPFLTDAEVEEFRREVRQKFDPTQMPTTGHQTFPLTFYFAALLGLHQELESLIATWPDDNQHIQNYYYAQAQLLIFGLGSRDRVVHHAKRMKMKLPTQEFLRAWLAHTEFSEIDFAAESVLAESNKDRANDLIKVLVRIKAPEAAPAMLRLWLESRAQATARQWMDDNLGCAIAGLLATAAGQGKLAEAALGFLRDQKKRGYGGFIEECLKNADAAVAEKIRRDVIDFEEKTYPAFDDKTTPQWLTEALKSAPTKSAKLPGWADPLNLPPLLVGERSLSPMQSDKVLQALKSASFDAPSPLLKALREHGDRLALDAFAWRLFERWSQDGCPSKEKWAMGAIGFLGNDRSALKITPLIRAWPGESQHQRAVYGLECLRAMGTDTALMQLNGIAQKLKFKGLKEKARQAMDGIAAERGMTKAELEDCIVPDCELDERGNRTFDFGPRQFTFALDKDLKPMVRDEAGKLKGDLPKPGAKDDPAKATAAVAEWKLLKKTLKEVLKVQTDRLEQAMVTGRRWPRNTFESLLVKHPLMTHLVRRVLWGIYDDNDNLKAAFRVTEEQDYADEKDDPFDLGDAKTIGCVHVAHLSKEQAAKWGEVFSDYEIIPPFQQLGRTIYHLEPGEEKEKIITRFAKVKINPLTMVGMLDRMGYMRGTPQDGGCFCQHYKPFYGPNITALIEYDGVPIGYMEGWDDQHLNGCYFVQGVPSYVGYPDHAEAVSLSEVHPVVMSEVLRDLHALASKGTE